MWYLFELKKITIRNRVEMKYMVWNEVPVPASTGQYTDHHLRISIINEPRYTNRLLLMRFYYRPNILRNFIKILTLEHDSETYRKRYLKKSFAGRIVLIISFFCLFVCLFVCWFFVFFYIFPSVETLRPVFWSALFAASLFSNGYSPSSVQTGNFRL